jgi:hypothetical protein
LRCWQFAAGTAQRETVARNSSSTATRQQIQRHFHALRRSEIDVRIAQLTVAIGGRRIVDRELRQIRGAAA